MGYITLDHKGTIYAVNFAGAALLGDVQSQLIGRPFKYFLANDQSRFLGFLDKVFAGQNLQSGEFTLKSTGETPLFVRIEAQVPSSGVDECHLAIIDITELRKVEVALEKLNENLESQVVKRTAELEHINLELEAFNYSAAHDLRQPLNQIALYSQSFEMQCSNQMSEECSAYIRGIYESNLRMNHLIETLLNFSRMGRNEPKRQSVDLCTLANDVAMALKQSEPERQVDFQIAAEITANGDAELLRVVLDNLLSNAWKFTSTREQAIIDFGSAEIEGEPVYFVRDNGVGFDKTDADKLFIPFKRLPGAEAFKGSGIGLATVERIVRRHGGRIWAEGEPDKGSTFYFTL